jgi:hypothetical protein
MPDEIERLLPWKWQAEQLAVTVNARTPAPTPGRRLWNR